jgi:large subunit ribosomal protein L21
VIKKHFKGDKVIAFKYKPKKRYRRKVGHRQQLTLLSLEKISVK